MKIDFSQTVKSSYTDSGVKTGTGAYSSQEGAAKTASLGFRLDISGKVMDNAATGLYAKNGTEQVQGRTIEDCLQGISGLDMSVQHNYMAVMSNFLSAEDFAKLKEDGYDLKNMSPEDLVTVTDQIKVELAKAGVTVVGYNDNIDGQTVDAISSGNLSVKAQIESALKSNDLPVTDNNVSGCEEALKIAREISDISENGSLSDESIRYMMDNALEPELNNIYLAQFKSQPYPKVNISDEQMTQMKKQIQDVIESAGLEVDESTLEDAKWLMENQLPLTADNLVKYTEFKNLKLPLDDKLVLEEAAKAIAGGQRAENARLIHNERVFNEVRLAMTTEANLKLMKSDFSIDTAELEKTVEQLRQAEARLNSTLENSEQTEQKLQGTDRRSLLAELYVRTNSHVQDLKSMPAQVLFDFAGKEDYSLNQVYDKGAVLKNQYIRAGEAYEALKTEVRADLGDNIKKAFANVTDILEEMKLETSEANKRAVRILGYNQAELTPENIEKVKQADAQVTTVIDKLRPGAVLALIRDGKNPLGMSIKDLETELDGYNNNSEQQDEKYSEFLWKLEKNGKISPEERESYIGVYRLFRQVEKSDGAVVGSLAMQEAELSVKNLLSAVRTQRVTKQGMDVTVDEGFGGIEKGAEDFTKIDAQINMAMNDEQMDKQYNEAMAEEFREAMDCEEEILEALEHYELPVCYNNILAMREYLFDDGGIFKRLSKLGKQLQTEELIEEFDTPQGAQEALEDLCEHAKEDIEIAKAETAVNYDEFMELRRMGMQIGLIQNFVKRNEYKLPINVNGEETSVNLKLIDGNGESKVDANLHTNELGTLSLHLEVADNNVSGYMVAHSYDGEEYLKEIQKELTEKLRAEGLEVNGEISVFRKRGKIEVFERASEEKKADAAEEKTEENKTDNRTLFKLAKIFLKTVQNFG